VRDIAFLGPPVVVTDSAAVSITEAQIGAAGGAAYGPDDRALFVEGSSVALFDCLVGGGVGRPAAFSGGQLASPPLDGGTAIELVSGSLTLFGCTVRGGAGGAGGFHVLCTTGADGGTGLLLGAGSPAVENVDSEIVGGDPGSGGLSCAGGQAGPAIVELSGQVFGSPAQARWMAGEARLRPGDPVEWTVAGEPGDLAWFWYSSSTVHLRFDAVRGVLLAPIEFGLTFLGPLGDGTGGRDFGPAPPLPPGVALTLHGQALFFDAEDGFVLSNAITVVASGS